ncbi:MAG: hypothetical protein ACE5I1_07775 [bacterium]
MANRTPQKRDFETQGNQIPGQHFLVENRQIVSHKGKPIRQLVDQGRYFTIFAPRQMGKTSFFVELAKELRRDTLYVPILLTFETVKNFSTAEFYQDLQQNMVSQLVARLDAIRCEQKNAAVRDTPYILSAWLVFAMLRS